MNSSKLTRQPWLAAVMLCTALGLLVGQANAQTYTYTLDGQFDQGNLQNVNHNTPNNHQLQLNQTIGAAFPFIWVAASARGTIVKINTRTGAILGEYSSAPDVPFGFPDPSRTTVSIDGSVWAGNRQAGSVVHVGLQEANQCIDRNGNGTIETSSGYGNVLAWPNLSGVDTDGGVETAVDECILHFTRTSATATRHVSIDANNDVWVSGRFGGNDAVFNLIDSATGNIIRTEGPFAGGGYGGLVDGNGVLWSASSGGPILRWDPNAPLSGTNPTTINVTNYGMALDGFGNVWTTTLGNQVHKIAPNGTVLGTFPIGSGNAQGLAIDGNNHVWVSSSLFGGTTVSHLLNDGTFIGNVTGVGNGSTGVAVDADGKIWTANINSSDATRIDPNGGPLGTDGITRVGAVDLTVALPGASPYNYSDMTGAVVLGGTSPQGTWTIVQDGGPVGLEWENIRWNTEPQGSEPPGTSITFVARAADSLAGLGSESFIPIANGVDFSLDGKFIEVRATLRPDMAGISPVLSDVRITAVPEPGTLALAGLAGLGLFVVNRRRRAKNLA